MYCARHALGIKDEEHRSIGEAESVTAGEGITKTATTPSERSNGASEHSLSNGSLGDGDGCEGAEESFLLVLGDHLYRRGAGTTHACADQLIHAFLEHGDAGKPAIGLKVGGGHSLVESPRHCRTVQGLTAAPA